MVAKTAHVQVLQAVGVMLDRQWLLDDISNHKKRRKNFNYEFTSHTSFAAHASSQTRESGGNRAYTFKRLQERGMPLNPKPGKRL